MVKFIQIEFAGGNVNLVGGFNNTHCATKLTQRGYVKYRTPNAAARR